MFGREFSYAIHSRLPKNPESPASVGTKFVRTLDALTNIDPLVFKNWEVMDLPARDSAPLAAVRSHIGPVTEKNVSRDHSDDRAAREAFNDARSAKLRYEYPHPSGSSLGRPFPPFAARPR